MKKKKLTKQEMRLAIAEDVLEQLRIGRYYATSNYFLATGPLRRRGEVDFSSDPDNFRPKGLTGPEVQEEIKRINKCGVCAIGAALISGIRLYDGVSGDNFDPFRGRLGTAVNRFFTTKQLGVMEDFFEIFVEGFKNKEGQVDYTLRRVAINMGRDERMRLVFNSIKDNKGRIVKQDMLKRLRSKAKALATDKVRCSFAAPAVPREAT